jgi:hypothetical protein
MSPSWSDLALARTALAEAVARGVIDERIAEPAEPKASNRLPRVRRILRRRVASLAL